MLTPIPALPHSPYFLTTKFKTKTKYEFRTIACQWILTWSSYRNGTKKCWYVLRLYRFFDLNRTSTNEMGSMKVYTNSWSDFLITLQNI